MVFAFASNAFNVRRLFSKAREKMRCVNFTFRSLLVFMPTFIRHTMRILHFNRKYLDMRPGNIRQRQRVRVRAKYKHNRPSIETETYLLL